MKILCKGLVSAFLFLYTLHVTGQSITKTSAGTATTVAILGGAGNWTSFNVSQIQNADGSNASVTVSGKKASYHIRATNWGYTIGGSGSFPAGATLSGIKVEIKRNASQGAAVDAQNLQLLINGAATGSPRGRNRTQWTSQSSYVTYGSTSDKWGSSLTINDIVNTTFGVQVAAKGALKGNSNSVANIDHIRITIYYNLKVFYSKSTGSFANLATWGLNPDGTGTAPVNFTTDGQIFVVTNRAAVSLDAALTISGANSKLVVGDINNALAKTTLTIPSAYAYSGVLDCSSKNGTAANSSDVIITNTNVPTFGNLEQGTTVTYNAAGSQAVSQANYDNLTISGTGTKTIQSTGTGMRVDGVFTVSSGAILALNGQVLINSADPAGAASCVVNNGTISGTGEVYLTGDGLSIISGTGSISTLETDNKNDVSIQTGANQIITTALILSSGAFTNSGTFSMGAGSTIYRDQGVFSASSPGANAYDVSYTSSFLDDGISTNATGNELAGTNLRNVSVDLPANETITLNTTRTVKGNFSINTGSFSAGATILNLAGNFTNNSSFIAATSTIVLNGSSVTTQTIGGTGIVTFSTLTVNATGNGGVTLTKDITVTTALTLTAGKVTTGTNTLIYSLAAGTVARTNGYIAGNLRKNVSTGATARVYEVGTTSYTPIQVSFASVTTAGTLDATVTAGDNPNIGSSNIDASKSVNTYWEVTKPTGSALVFTTYGITATYTLAENDATGNAPVYKLGKYLGSAWSYILPGTTPTSTQLIVPTNSFTSATGFGQFQVGVQGTQPVVSAQPSNQTTCNSASTNFSATASSGIITSIVWQISTNNGSSYSNLTINSPYSVNNPSLPSANNAAVTSVLNISNSSALTGNLYRAVFTNASGNANSNGGLLTANNNPAITTQPVVQTACVGNSAMLVAAATGNNLFYQWRKGGNNISGATSSSYNISNVATVDAANYDIVITNSCSSVTSTVVALTVNELPAVTTQPAGQTVCSGNTTTFTIVAAGAGLSYQWQKDNVALINGVNGVSGATAATLTISSTPISAAGIYNVIVTGTCSPSVASNDVVLTVDEGAIITGHPSVKTVCAGTANVQFTVTATGTGLTFQWKKDGNVLANGANLSGAATATLTLATAATADAGNYTVVVGTTNCTSGITSNTAALTITTQVTPSLLIAITSGSNPTCSGTSVTFTATPTNGGTPFYQWQKDGLNVGTNSATYTDAGITPGSITCVLTSGLGCVTTPTASSNIIAFTVVPNTWLAGSDGNWSNALNWCSGIVPTAGTDVIIPGANAPYPALSANVSIKALEIQNGATLIIGAHTLTVNDVITGTGAITGSSASNLTINGPGIAVNSNIRFNAGNQVLKNLTISNATITLHTPLSITGGNVAGAAGTVTVTNGLLKTNGQLTLSSNLHGTARIADGFSGGNYISGDVTVERYIPNNANRAWRLLSIPTVGQTIHESWQEGQATNVDPGTGYGTIVTSNSANWQANGYDEKTPGNSLLVYNQASDQLSGVPNTAAPIATTEGYFIYIRGDRSVKQSASILSPNSTTLRTKGTIYQGTQNAINIPAGKLGLIGNIYPSTIDMRNILTAGGSVNTSFSVWDPKLIGSYGLGAYQSFTLDNDNYIVTPGGGSYGSTGSINNTIQSGQAFFAQAIETDGTIRLTENAKTSGSTNTVFSPPVNTAKRLVSRLYAVTDTASNLADGTLQLFSSDYDNSVNAMDAKKLYNFGENFYISKNNSDLIVEKRKIFTQDDTIYYKIEGLKRRSYQLEFISTELSDPNLSAWLEDSYTKSSTPVSLNGKSVIKFYVDANAASSNINRFKMVFKPNGILPVTFINTNAFLLHNNVSVTWQIINQLNVSGYEIERSADGQNFTKAGTKKATGSAGATINYEWLDVNALPGSNFYRVVSIDNDGKKQYSRIVKVNIANKNSSISIYPNPVTNGVVGLVFNELAAGIYTARLLSSNGALLLNKQLPISPGNTRHMIQVGSKLPAGNYLLEIIHPDKTKTIEQLIISK